jgi:DNA-binding CsgD family transcriptional regulator
MEFFTHSSAPSLKEAVNGFIVTLDDGRILWLNDSAHALLKANLGHVPIRIPAELISQQSTMQNLEKSRDKINLAFQKIFCTTELGETMCFRLDSCAAEYLPVKVKKGWLYVIDTRRTEVKILNTFSPREREVLRLLKDGMSDKEIAARLSISEKTVQTYTDKLYKKMGVHNRTEAAIRAATILLLK